MEDTMVILDFENDSEEIDALKEIEIIIGHFLPDAQLSTFYLVMRSSNKTQFSFRINYYFTYFSTVVPHNSCVFLSCRPFVVNMTFSTGLVHVSQEREETPTPTRPVENFFLTTKGIQEKTTVAWDDGGKIGKIITNSN
jgi:hypothetical protein